MGDYDFNGVPRHFAPPRIRGGDNLHWRLATLPVVNTRIHQSGRFSQQEYAQNDSTLRLVSNRAEDGIRKRREGSELDLTPNQSHGTQVRAAKPSAQTENPLSSHV